MDRIFNRTLRARNQIVKRSRNKAMQELRDSRHEIEDQRNKIQKLTQSNIMAERKDRREDWKLGPLAPNRLAGKDAGRYGTLPLSLLQSSEVLRTEREKYFNFVVSDRVVIVKGRERGKIGEVKEISEDRQTVTVENTRVGDIFVYPHMRESRNSKTTFISLALPIHIHDIRLVVPLRDNATGKIKDTIVEHMRAGEPFNKSRHGTDTPEHTRYVAGADNIPIPWPEAADPHFQPGPSDTPAWEVHSQSFTPSLSCRPHPESIVDELRQKYARTRTHHDLEYIQEKMREDAKEQWQRRRRMVLPQQEFQEKQVKVRKARAKREITEETLDMIRDMQKARLGRSSSSEAEKITA